MSNMVTRCPQCQTSFKVTEEHLKIANGAVRCGSCLLVFQARQHWVNPDNMSTAAPAIAPQSASPVGKFQFDQSAIDNNASPRPSDNPVEPRSEHAFVLPKVNIDNKPVVENKLADNKLPAENPQHKKLEEIGDDDRISDDLDIEDDEVEITPKSAVKKNEFGNPDDDYGSVFDDFNDQAEDSHFDEILDENFNDLDALLDDSASKMNDGDTADDAWAKDLLAEMQQENKPEVLDLSKVGNIRDVLTDFTNPVDVDAARRDLGFDQADPFAAREVGSAKPDRGNDGRAEMIAHIEPLPVEMLSVGARQEVDWKNILRWNAGAIALLLLLAVQYVGFNFNKLAKTDTTRPYMQTLCGIAGCKLPSVENWRYIKIQNLVVRQHPQVTDGLAVDAILFNVTGQDQPFPQLELYFSDLAKTPVASRRFDPAEYLSGELSGQAMIPPGRPVHIALEIVNPGEKAVNWSLQVAGKTD
ncbi:MAG TPA: DUF3426 domain-containing protein [Pseudomonadales bacterium]|nr:DUF3426 domain-containing protein [Pseudomonadales bacterium]